MQNFHAVLEFGDEEFGADCRANSREEAYAYFREQYPESVIVQLESDNDAAAREKRNYDWAMREYEDDLQYDDNWD